jgi:RNA polymerase I-associated factor PAF67
MYALFAICNALSPSRLDDNILNIVKDRYGDQFAKLSRGCVRSCTSPSCIVERVESNPLHLSAMKVSLPLRSSSSTHAQNLFPPTRRLTRTRISWQRTQKFLHPNPHSATSRSSSPTYARKRPCRRSAASSSCTRRSTQPSSRASSTRTKRRWCSR